MSGPRRPSSTTGELLLVHASGQPATLLESAGGSGVIPWMFLGQDYLALLAWERGLSAGFERLKLERTLDETARRMRPAFMRLIADLGRRHDSLAWWTSRVSERNTLVSSLFLDCCYLHVALTRLQQQAGPLCVVSESWGLLRCLEQAAREKRRAVRWVTPSLPWWRLRLMQTARMAARGWSFLRRRLAVAREARRVADGTDPLGARQGRSGVLLRTFVDDGCFRANGSFCDRHLPGVAEWLERQGYDVWTIPILFNVKRPYCDAWEWFAHNPHRFINADRYYRLSDILKTLATGWRQAFLPRGRVRLKTMDVTQLFVEQRRRFALEPSTLESMLITHLPRRLKQAGLRPELVIQGYENMIPEKAATLGFRRHMPGVKIVGFQHPVAPPMLLCHYVTAEEADFAPLPDRIVCNGRLFRDVLIREGLEPRHVVEGPALRYAHLHREDRTPWNPPDADRCVLVALPLEMGAAVEVLSKTLHALGEADIPVKVKPHPMMARDELLNACGIRSLPAGFEFVAGGMDEWLALARVVISSGSAVLYEALAAGVPVIAVGRESALNLNPLDWLDDAPPLRHSADEIRAETLRCWRLTAGELDDCRRRGRAILESSFNAVCDKRLRALIDEPLPACDVNEPRTVPPRRQHTATAAACGSSV